MDVYSKCEKFVKEGVNYDDLYEKNAANNKFVIKFDSQEEAEAAMNDIKDLDEETKVFDVVQDGKQITVNTNMDRFIELATAGEIYADEMTTMFAIVGIISFNHNAVMVDEIGHAVVTRK